MPVRQTYFREGMNVATFQSCKSFEANCNPTVEICQIKEQVVYKMAA